MLNITKTVFLAALCAVSVLAGAQNAAPQSFDIPGHGQLQLAVPGGWQVEVDQQAAQLPVTLDFSPRAGAPFHVMLTALWPAPPDTALPDLASVREKVAQAAKAAQSQAVENPVLVKPLSGASNQGYYFTATDRTPKPGEFKYLTQGMIQVGSVDVAFSVLTNDGQDSVIKAALEVLRTAAYKAPSK